MGRYSQSVVLDAAANKDSYCFHLNFTTDNLAFGKKAVASSISADAGEPSAAIDASDGSRWASEPRDEEWIYVDLGEPTEIASVILNWEAAHAKAYKLLISDDAINWKEIYINEDSKGGVEEIKIKPVCTRYVKMQGLKQATMWGYSLYEFELYGRKKKPTDLTPVHFIKLELNDENGQLLSDNFYWRSNKPGDYKALNNLPKAKLRTTSSLVDSNGKKVIKAKIENVGSSVAFAVHVQAIRSSDEHAASSSSASVNRTTGFRQARCGLQTGKTTYIIYTRITFRLPRRGKPVGSARPLPVGLKKRELKLTNTIELKCHVQILIHYWKPVRTSVT